MWVKLLVSLAALLLLVSADACSTATSGLTTIDKALECLKSLDKYTAAEKNAVLNNMRTVTEGYAFVDYLADPPKPFDDYKIDLFAEFDRMESTDYASLFEFYSDMAFTVKKCRDAHTHFNMPACFSAFFAIQAMPISAAKGSGSTMNIIVSEPAGIQEQVLNALGVLSTVRAHVGATIAKINGVNALDFVKNYANTKTFTGRDIAQRTELLFEAYFMNPNVIPHQLPEKYEGKDQIVAELSDGTVISVPYVAVPAVEKAMSGSELVANYCPANGIDSVPTVLPTIHDAVAFHTGADALIGITHIPEGADHWTRHALRNPLWRHRPVMKAAGPPSDHVQTIVDTDDWKAYVFAGASGMPAKVCVLTCNTYAPKDMNGWIQTFAKAISGLRDAGCSVTSTDEDVSGDATEDPLFVYDVRSNGGGAVILLDILFDTLWPGFFPHHLSVMGGRLSDDSEAFDYASELLGMTESATRELYTFKPVPVCDQTAETGACGRFWREPGMSFTKSFTLPSGRTRSMKYLRPVLQGPLLWEKPQGMSAQNWKELFGRRYSDEVFVHAEVVEQLRPLAPKLNSRSTVFVGGPFSASCTGHTLTRAKVFDLGTVVLTGGIWTGDESGDNAAHHGRDLAGLVPGGNVIGMSDVYKESGHEIQWPRPGTDVAYTTSASLPYNTFTDEADATTPNEFVVVHPDFELPYWSAASVRHTTDETKDMIEALATEGIVGTTCVTGSTDVWVKRDSCFGEHAFYGLVCEEGGNRYDTSSCEIQACDWGYKHTDTGCEPLDVFYPHGVFPRPAPEHPTH